MRMYTNDFLKQEIKTMTVIDLIPTDETLLNTIAEKVLGLPQDHRPDKGVPFNQIPA